MAAAAYRAGVSLHDARSGITHDYTAKSGILASEIVLPRGASVDREILWNAGEGAEKRKDARTAREWIVALPSEIGAADRKALVRSFSVALTERYGVAVDYSVHAPDKQGDKRNHHAHILTTTRAVSLDAEGRPVFGDKTVIELSDKARRERGLGAGAEEVLQVRQLWEELTNHALERAGREERVSAKSLEAQGIDRVPTKHLGPTATDFERRTGEKSRRRLDFEQQVAERLQRAKAIGEKERQQSLAANPRQLQIESVDLAAAKQARETVPELANAVVAPGVLALTKAKDLVQEKAQGLILPGAPEISGKSTQARPDQDLGLPHGSSVTAGEAEPSPTMRTPVPEVLRPESEKSRLVAERSARLAKVQARALARENRRIEVHEQLVRQEPKAPKGLTAAFRKKAFEAEHADWLKKATLTEQLARQGRALRQRVAPEPRKVEQWVDRQLQLREIARRKQALHEQRERMVNDPLVRQARDASAMARMLGERGALATVHPSTGKPMIEAAERYRGLRQTMAPERAEAELGWQLLEEAREDRRDRPTSLLARIGVWDEHQRRMAQDRKRTQERDRGRDRDQDLER